MAIVVFDGQIGSGKTLAMVAFAQKAHLAGREVYSNIKMKFAHHIFTRDDWKNWGKNQVQFPVGTAIFLDEAHMFFDSRRSAQNVEKSWFVLQSRKRGCDLFLTTQIFGSLDLRARMNCSLIIGCEFQRNPERDGRDYVILTKEFRDRRTGNWYAHPIKYRLWANALYNMYDTNYIVMPE